MIVAPGDLRERAIEDRLRALLERRHEGQPILAELGQLKDAFDVDLDTDTVSCPNEQTAKIRWTKDGSGAAQFGVFM